MSATEPAQHIPNVPLSVPALISGLAQAWQNAVFAIERICEEHPTVSREVRGLFEEWHDTLARATQEEHSDSEGRHWELWIFRDRSSIRLDIPGRLNESRWQVSRDPHLAIMGPQGEILSRYGVVVPGGSEPAHHRVF